MNNTAKYVLLLGGVSAFALIAAPAMAQQGSAKEVEEVVVTGSRVITDSTRSPTPLTAVSVDQLRSVSSATIPDALNKLPVFQGSSTQRSFNNPSGNASGNVVSLRNFGAQRTLVLLDGHRLTPSSAAGTANVDVIPQMLLQRVDIVTGGASAVYGSDAVTGVVNFILDKSFTGVKFDANVGGFNSRGIGRAEQIGVAAGRSLFDGRGHIEGSIRTFNQDEVPRLDTLYGKDVYMQTGAGTAANPFTQIMNGRNANETFGGKITCTNCGTLSGMQFVGPGIVGPFVPGVATGTNGTQIGGDGMWSKITTGLAALKSTEGFARFSYDLSDNVTGYVNLFAATSMNQNWFFTSELRNGANSYFRNNPFLPASFAVGGTGTTFTLAKAFDNISRDRQPIVKSDTHYGQVNAGLNGKLGDYAWDVFYTHGESHLTVQGRNNIDLAKSMAANDAVLSPTGTAVCHISTTANAARFPGCIPLNPFGPTSTTPEMMDYITADTSHRQINTVDDFGGGISGDVFNLPAGPVRMAVSAEYRKQTFVVKSDFLPTDTVDCTGLRLCTPNSPRYWLNVVAPTDNKMNVWEAAVETEVPLLAGLPLIDSLSMNLAARHTDYSVSGAVNTWKVGLDYHLNSSVRFRGTASTDIRAPTLNDLFQPSTVSSTGYTDLHTGIGAQTQTSTQGNPDLVPEEAKTRTVGVVFTPSFLPGLNVAVDYYAITLSNAIGTLNAANNQVQALCEASNGSNNVCALYVRPLPFSDRSAANFPTLIYARGLNAADQRIRGYDFEANYRFALDDVISNAPGNVSMRLLANYQPTNRTLQFEGAVPTFASTSKTRTTTTLTYSTDTWRVNVTDRWYSSFSKVGAAGQIYAEPKVPSFNLVDLQVSHDMKFGGVQTTLYGQVDNLLDATPPVNGGGSANPGYGSPIPAAYPILGRTFTLGIRGRF